MPGENDGMEEALEGGLSMTLTAAGRVGEQIAVRMQNDLARAKARDEEYAAEAAQRLHVQRLAARAQLAPVSDGAWWDHAGPKEIAQAYTTATAWRDLDPEAGQAAEHIRDQVRERFGVDIDRPADRDVFEARARESHAEIEVMDDHQTPPWDRLTEEQRMAAIDNEERNGLSSPSWSADLLEAQLLMNMAERIDRQAEEERAAAIAERDPAESELDEVHAASDETRAQATSEEGRDLYDTAERREVLAQGLMDRGIEPDVVATRVRADVSQARPATEAAHAPTERAPKARKARAGRWPQRQNQGVDR